MDDSVIIRFPFIHGWVVWIYDMNESSSSQEAPLHFSRTGALNLAQFVHDRLGGRPGIYAMFFHQKNDHLMPEHDDQDLGVANFFRQIHLTCLPSPKKMMVNGWFGAVQVQKNLARHCWVLGLVTWSRDPFSVNFVMQRVTICRTPARGSSIVLYIYYIH